MSRLLCHALLLCLLALAPGLGAAEPAPAQHALELARLHVETSGGVERLNAFKALEAEGQVSIGGRTLRTRILAAAPNRVRIETEGGGQVLVQGFEGSGLPWQAQVQEGRPPEINRLSGEAAAEFIRDAEFQDLLFEPTRRGRTLRYIGPLDAEEGQVERIRVVDADGTERELWLDARTYLIVRQRSLRRLPGGRVARLETRFSDFRPVSGIVLPHRIRVYGEGRKLHETELGTVRVNPELAESVFRSDSVRPPAEDKAQKPEAAPAAPSAPKPAESSP